MLGQLSDKLITGNRVLVFVMLTILLVVAVQVIQYNSDKRVTNSITATCPQVARSYAVTTKLMQRAVPPFSAKEIADYQAQRVARLKALGCD